MTEIIAGVFIALVLHSMVQTFIIDSLTMSFRLRKLEKAASVFATELDKVSVGTKDFGRKLSNPTRTRRTSPDRLSEIFEEEMGNWRFDDKGPTA